MTPTPESLTEAVRLVKAQTGKGVLSDYIYVNDAARFIATALDEHKAKMREVSDAVKMYEPELKSHLPLSAWPVFQAFIIPEPPVDPLVEAISDCVNNGGFTDIPEYADRLRTALAKRNARIVIDAPDKPDAAEVLDKALNVGGWKGKWESYMTSEERQAAIAVIAEALGEKS